jgi:ATP-dependent DNA helicase DinG
VTALQFLPDSVAALVVLPGPKCAVADEAGARTLKAPDARALAEAGPVLVAHAAMTARRLGLQPPVRTRGVLDALELYAFVRPARFCAPSAAGLGLPVARWRQNLDAIRDAAAARRRAVCHPFREMCYRPGSHTPRDGL